jgi:DNA-directed RNA polymerase subunit RPC12/RpoP
MDKTTGHLCPRCGLEVFNIYYEEEADLELGASCDGCGLRGFFVRGKLVELTPA